MGSQMRYASLVCSRHVKMAVRCLTSFVVRGGIKELYIFDDGSMSKKDKVLLNSIPCTIKVIDREKCIEYVNSKISNYSNSIKYKEKHAFGIKLIDIPIYLNEDIMYVDSDVMFYRNFKIDGIENNDMIFMYEGNTSYSVKYLDQFIKNPINLVKNLNSGFMYISKSAHKIKKIDSFLGNDKYKNEDWLIEQTAWAHLAAECTSSYWSPSQVAIANERGEYSDNVIAVHYISTYRDRLKKDHLTLQDESSDSSSVIRLLPSKRSRFTDGIISRALARFS